MPVPSLINRVGRALRLALQPDSQETLPEAPLLDDDELRTLFLAGLASAANSHQPDVRTRGAGDALSAFRGAGLEVEESRAYQPGDEPRFINWRLSARSGSLQTSVFREERRRAILIVIDRRNGMRFGTRSRLKLTQAVRAACLVAARAHHEHATVETLLIDEALHWSPPETTEQGILGLLKQAAAPAMPLDTPGGEIDIDTLLEQIEERIVPGTVLHLFSDLAGFEKRHAPGVMRLAAGNPLRITLLQDPAELALPRAGRLRFEGSDGRFEIDTDDTAVRNDYRQAAEAEFARRRTLFTELGITCTPLSTHVDEPDRLLTDGQR